MWSPSKLVKCAVQPNSLPGLVPASAAGPGASVAGAAGGGAFRNLAPVEDLFDPPDQDWVRVQPRLARMERLGAALTSAAVAVVVVVGGLLLDRFWPWAVLALVLLVALLGWDWWLIGRRVRNWGYAELESELWITHGAMFRTLSVVPYGRMQLVDVTVGPLERRFGLASVELHTASAGTDALIPGLLPEEAARLRDRLTEVGEAESAGL